MESKEAYIRKNTIILSFVSRSAVIVSAVILNLYHLLEDEFAVLLLLMLPLTGLYTTLFLKFIFQNKYQRQGAVLNKSYTNMGFYFLLALNLIDLIVICLKSIDTTIFNDNTFFLLIALAETGLAIYAGFYLADLFTNKLPEANVRKQ